MTLLQNELYIGAYPAEHGLVWASGDPRTSDGELDHNRLTEHYRADRDSKGNWVLRNENTDTTIISIHRESNELTINADLKLNKTIIGDIHIDGTSTRLTGFDENGIHLIRYSSTDSDKIMEIQRYGSNDYDLWIHQDGDRNRVHTKGDDDIDADYLGGVAADQFAILSEDETVTGEWTFDDDAFFDRAFFSHDAAVSAFGSSLLVGHGNSDSFEFETYTGNLLVDGDIWVNDGENLVLTEETGFFDIEDNGIQVGESIRTLNFGDGLTVSEASGDIATIDWETADVPSRVYQDGNLVVDDAEGIDFRKDFEVDEDEEGRASVILDTEDFAPIDGDIEITGEWTFNINEGGQLQIPMDYVEPEISATEYPFGISTMEIGRDTAYPGEEMASMMVRHAENRTLQFGGGMDDRFWMRRYHEGEGGWGEFNELWTNQNDGEGSGLDADLLDGYDSDVFPKINEQSTIEEWWDFEDGVKFERDDEWALGWENDSGREMWGGWQSQSKFSFMPHAGGSWDPDSFSYDYSRNVWEFDSRPKVNGSDVVLMDDPVLDQNDSVYQSVSIAIASSSASGATAIASVVSTDTERTVIAKAYAPSYDEWSDGDIWFHEGVGIYINVDGQAVECATV
jgi:hypothetical protein